jgi:hypothetical protein
MFNMNYILSQLLEVDVHLVQQYTKHVRLPVNHIRNLQLTYLLS